MHRGSPTLEVHDLSIGLVRATERVELVSRVGFQLHAGRTLALVGESGCGKSLTALSLLKLFPGAAITLSSGRILFRPTAGEAVDLARLGEADIVRFRGSRLAMIFQESMTALHPLKTIGAQIVEGIQRHLRLRPREARQRVEDWLERVGLTPAALRFRQYPHELSGGMRQRATIAMALACMPAVLIADEPTTALDATVQAQVLDLLRNLQRQTGLAILLITHDFGVVSKAADDVAVMYAGRIVEYGPTESVLTRPSHPYTRALLDCVPRPDSAARRLRTIPGRVPEATDYPSGCRFHPRCDLTRLWAAASPAAATIEAASGLPVLRRCVFGDGPGGTASAGAAAVDPRWRRIGPGHEAACWELP